MNYVCKAGKCHVRQPVRENGQIPKCDCGKEMIPDPTTRDAREAAKLGIYRRY